ncbi:MAG TPA: NAD(P)/FAD-dependent oxidoreductase, partial [Thermoanaerobaculia bacterium]|nr:NAD(P)/FAD-dependent oxidoreductase [Thermoanaerobaculia bacterium]
MKDVVVIGGGPAGSALGCYLAQAGIECTIYEAVEHPRPHVGESLVTATTRTLEEIGMLPVMEAEGFVHKYGATWHNYTDDSTFSVRFAEVDQPGIEQPYSYHVDRARFDHLLLQQAERLGAEVRQRTRVREVLFDGGRAVGVRLADDGGADVRCRTVVDASGRATLLGRQLGLKAPDPHFDQYAVAGWFEGVDRGPQPETDYLHAYFLPARRGWAWQIPITPTVTSMGVVAEKEVFRNSKRRIDEYFTEQVATSPGLARAMRDARMVQGPITEGDYSYVMRRFAGPGWILAGDAARFVDPIFSSGVSVAFASARSAAEVIAAVRRGEDEAAAIAAYEGRLRAGTEIWYEFIRIYYKLQVLFTRFIAPRRYRSQLVQLLQGEVYDRAEVPVLA